MFVQPWWVAAEFLACRWCVLNLAGNLHNYLLDHYHSHDLMAICILSVRDDMKTNSPAHPFHTTNDRPGRHPDSNSAGVYELDSKAMMRAGAQRPLNLPPPLRWLCQKHCNTMITTDIVRRQPGLTNGHLQPQNVLQQPNWHLLPSWRDHRRPRSLTLCRFLRLMTYRGSFPQSKTWLRPWNYLHHIHSPLQPAFQPSQTFGKGHGRRIGALWWLGLSCARVLSPQSVKNPLKVHRPTLKG